MQQNNTNKKESKFNSEKQKIFIKLIEEGKTFAKASQEVGINRATEFRYRKVNKQYREQVETAKQSQIEAVEDVLFQMCMDKNITAVIFFLKCKKSDVYHKELKNTDNPNQTVDFDFKVINESEANSG